jgi:riboflavin synthase
MFTGIIQETGTVETVTPAANSVRFVIRADQIARGVKIGASIAVNGCCLTLVKTSGRGKLLHFDVLQESWRLTNLQFAVAGRLVNLERPLRPDGELGGHFVTGHVDGLGVIKKWERVGRDHVLEIRATSEIMQYIVHKGSIAVDGISLTIAGVLRGGFRIWIIPHTREITALKQRSVGDAVNLEADLLGKYVLKFISGTGLIRRC